MSSTFLFFCHAGGSDVAPPPPPECHVELWRPGLLPWSAYGGRRTDYAWWLVQRAGLFANGDLAACRIWSGGRLLHRSSVFPRYFRYPFMSAADLQIGDTWTRPEMRGRGLAVHAVRFVLTQMQRPGRRFWYVVAEDNTPSIKVIEKCGFVLFGTGVRTSRYGLRMLGAFEVTHQRA